MKGCSRWRFQKYCVRQRHGWRTIGGVKPAYEMINRLVQRALAGAWLLGGPGAGKVPVVAEEEAVAVRQQQLGGTQQFGRKAVRSVRGRRPTVVRRARGRECERRRRRGRSGGGRRCGRGRGCGWHGAQPLGPAPVGRPAALRKPVLGEAAVGAPPANDVFSDRLFLALLPRCRGLVFGLGLSIDLGVALGVVLGVVLGVGAASAAAAAAGRGVICVAGLAAAAAATGNHLGPS